MYRPTMPLPGGATVTPIFHWSGSYAGFITDGWLFDVNARYLGWCDGNGWVWKADGAALGEVVDENYILRNLLKTPPVRRTPRVPPVPPTPPNFPGSRLPRIPKPGWIDPLVSLLHLPTRDELLGDWRLDEEQLSLLESGAFAWSAPSRVTATGSWELTGQFITLRDSGDPAALQEAIYRIIEFSGDTLMLRWHTQVGRSLPFVLRRSKV